MSRYPSARESDLRLLRLDLRLRLARLHRLRLRHPAQRQPHLLVLLLDPQDARRDRLTDREVVLQLAASELDLGDVRQAFEPLVDVDEQAEVGDVHHLALDHVPNLVGGHEVLPLVGQELLDRQRHPLVLDVDVGDPGAHRVALLDHLAGVLDALGPAHVGDVDQAVDLLGDLDEGAELGEVAHLALDHRAHRMGVAQLLPGIALHLAQRQRDPPLLHVELGDDGVHLVAHVEDLGRVDDLLGPRHLGYVDQALDSRLELHEGAIVDQADHLAVHPRAHRVLLVDQRPGILRALFVAQRHPLGLAVELEHRHLDLVADREMLGRVVDAAPGDVGDVEEAVDPAQVDEHAVVGDVLDHAREHRALAQPRQGLGLLLLVLLLEHRLARQHDVVAPAVEADDLELQLLAAQRLEVLDRLDVHQLARQEGAHAHVHGQTPLDAVDHPALDDLAFLEAVLDVGPHPHPLGLLLGEEDVPLDVLGLLEQHVDVVADLDVDLARRVGELLDRDQALRLVADVDDDLVVGDADDAAADDLALGQVPHALVVERDELRVLFLALLLLRLAVAGDLRADHLFPLLLQSGATSLFWIQAVRACWPPLPWGTASSSKPFRTRKKPVYAAAARDVNRAPRLSYAAPVRGFHWRDGTLHADGVPLPAIAEAAGTPTYVYSASSIRAGYERLAAAFAALRAELHYAVKASPNLHLCRLLRELGAGMDVVSGGELERAWLAGTPMADIVFAGVGKTDDEIRLALDGRFGVARELAGRFGRPDPAGRGPVGLFNVESMSEAESIARVAAELGLKARGCVRVNPNIDPHTHEYTTTGKEENKFGIDADRIVGLFAAWAGHPALELVGLHVHLGSPVPRIEPYLDAIEMLTALIDELERAGHRVEVLNLGGGWPAASPDGETPPLEEYAARIAPLLAARVERGLRVLIEPGRSILAEAGLLLTRVHRIKRGRARTFVICDAGMHTLIRPALYRPFHFVWPVAWSGPEPARRERSEHVEMAGLESVDVVGPIC